jgi:DNA primase
LHNEKTPSFFVSPIRNTYYCFGCGEKGDIFSFVERFEGVDFKGALTDLAKKAGVEIVYEKAEDKEGKQTLFDMLEEATVFFEKNLIENKSALKYLKDRKLKDEFREWFRVGYAESGWNNLHEYLIERGYKEEDILKAGLIKRGEKGVYDTFRSRIMFPISDSTGRVVAFSGRIFPNDDKIAKYLNSPETELFNKSRVLYGFDKAKLSIRKSNFSILVEGQMDVLMSHQAGFRNTVALSGTALSSHQITMLKRLSSNIVLAFDADKAGIASAGRSAEMALAAGMDVKVAEMQEGVDPADLVKENPQKLKEAVRNSVHIITFYLDMLQREHEDKRAFNKAVEKTVLPFVARIESRIDQMHFIAEVARKLGVPEESVQAEVEKVDLPKEIALPKEEKKEVAKEVGLLTKRERDTNMLFGVLFSLSEIDDVAIDKQALEDAIKEVIGEEQFAEYEKKPELFEEETRFNIEEYTSKQQLQEKIDSSLRGLRLNQLLEEQKVLHRELIEAERDGNQKKHDEVAKKYMEISKEIQSLK